MTKIFTVLVAVLILAGCGNPYPNFYTLSPEGPSPTAAGIGIGVGPVTVAEYADRQNLVIQTGPNKMEVAELDLWSGDLNDSIARVLSVNIGRRLGTGNVRTYPWQRDSEIDYQIAMDISEFIAKDDGYAYMEANWRIYALPSRNLAASSTFIGKEPIATEDFEAVVAAQSRLLGKLSADISAAIRKR